MLGHAHLARLGGTCRLESSGSLANAVVMFLSGLSRTLAAGSNPLPLPLDGYGMPGRSLYVDPAATSLVIANAGGAVSLRIAVPAAPSLLGLWLYGQVAQLSPGGNAAGVALGNAVEHRLGGL